MDKHDETIAVLGLLCALAGGVCSGCASSPSAASSGAVQTGVHAPESWIRDRVAAAEARMAASEGGRLLSACIEAQGGLAAWYRAGSATFDFDYRPMGQPDRRIYTRNHADLWRAYVRQQELGEGADAELGWNGRVAWIRPAPAAFPSPARFWATTPYYFFALPFGGADSGVRHERMPDAELEGVRHALVKLSFEPGTGDAPDDYYILYVHPETKRLSAYRYVVSYPGFFPKKGHTPEKLMVLRDAKPIDGFIVPARYEVYAWSEAGPGDKVTDIGLGSVHFGEPMEPKLFDPPPDAVVSTEIEVMQR